MRKIIGYLVMMLPIIAYNLYYNYYAVPNGDINLWQVLIAFIIGAIFFKIGIDIKNHCCPIKKRSQINGFLKTS